MINKDNLMQTSKPHFHKRSTFESSKTVLKFDDDSDLPDAIESDF